ncbi:MAG: hypothetical protein ACTSYB_10990, partial [Candidatus Helarchaeota archaeon]
FVTGDLVSPVAGQSIELDLYNVTVKSQVYLGDWNHSEYYLRRFGRNNWDWHEDLNWNGNNWTNIIHSHNLTCDLYYLNTYVRDDFGNWIMNQTRIYINNTGQFTTLDIFVNEWGDVELASNKPYFWIPSLGYGVRLGIDTEVFNVTGLNSVVISIAKNDTFNKLSNYVAQENWNIFVSVRGNTGVNLRELTKIADPIIDEIERVFDIQGLLIPIEEKRPIDPTYTSYALHWAMNFTPSRNYEYFVDLYNAGVNGNLSRIFSKQNMLSADESSITYHIYPLSIDFGTYFGYPANVDWGDNVLACAWMKFKNVYNYTTLNQTFQFSLKNFLGIEELNADFEQGLTFAETYVFSQVACGNFTAIYPDNNFTIYLGNYYGMTPETYRQALLIKNGLTKQGSYKIDDIAFNFSAPYTKIDIISPTPGSVVHGLVDIIANATMLYPATYMANVSIYPAGYNLYDGIYIQPLKEFNIEYNATAHYWNGTWQALNTTFYNGWYDIVFTFYDALGHRQQNISRVYVNNTYYQETLHITVDQFGNISSILQFQGNRILNEFNTSIPEYSQLNLAVLMANNPYLNNYSKSFMSKSIWNVPPCDVWLAIYGSPGLSQDEMIQLSEPVKDDFEQVFGIEGNLSVMSYYPSMIMGTGWSPMSIIFWGCNYSSSVTYEQFINYFHHQIPNGLNNTVPLSTLTGNESSLQWALFLNEELMPQPSNFKEEMNMLIQTFLFYEQYFGTDYFTNTTKSHFLSLTQLFGVPRITFTSPSAADSIITHISVATENANITTFSPDLAPFLQRQGDNSIGGIPVQKNPWYGDRYYYYGEMAYLTFDDINLTFEEPMFRVAYISPLPGANVNGLENVTVQIYNQTPMTDVTLKVYTDEEIEKLDSYTLMGSRMPYSRPPGKYGEVQMQYVNESTYTTQWPFYQHPNGSLWLEVVVGSETYSFYAYNSSQINVANTNPLAVNVLTPSDGAQVSDMITLEVQVMNSTPVTSVACNVWDQSKKVILDYISLDSQGSGVYSAPWGTHGLRNGTYYLEFQVKDTYGATAYNDTVSINVANPHLFEIIFLTTELEAANNANITANATGPYP